MLGEEEDDERVLRAGHIPAQLIETLTY